MIRGILISNKVNQNYLFIYIYIYGTPIYILFALTHRVLKDIHKQSLFRCIFI